MRDSSDHTLFASSPVPNELPSLSAARLHSGDVGRTTAFPVSAFPSHCARSAPLPKPRPLHRTPSSESTGKGEVTLIMPQVEMGQGAA